MSTYDASFAPSGSLSPIPEQDALTFLVDKGLADSILDPGDPERTPTMPHPLPHPPQGSFTPSGLLSQGDHASATQSFPHSVRRGHPQIPHLERDGLDPGHTARDGPGMHATLLSSFRTAGTAYDPALADSRFSLSGLSGISMPENRDGLYPGPPYQVPMVGWTLSLTIPAQFEAVGYVARYSQGAAEGPSWYIERRQLCNGETGFEWQDWFRVRKILSFDQVPLSLSIKSTESSQDRFDLIKAGLVEQSSDNPQRMAGVITCPFITEDEETSLLAYAMASCPVKGFKAFPPSRQGGKRRKQ